MDTDEERDTGIAPEAPELPEVPPPPEAALAAPDAEKTQLQAQLQEERRRRAGLDRELNRLRGEIGRLQARGAETGNLEVRLGDIEALILEQQETSEGGGEPEAAPRSPRQRLEERRQERARAEKERRATEWDAAQGASWRGISRDLQKRDIDPDLLAGDAEFLRLWGEGNLEAAEVRASHFSPTQSSPAAKPTAAGEAEESVEEKVSRLAEERYKKMLKERGLTTVDKGSPGPSGLAGLSRADITRRIAQPDGLEWFRKNEPAIDRLVAEGKLK